jgi:2-polyprenyl-3-methyl-5-hydroxy-6-metoxy-1,4-benzoquinol methylase
MLKELSLAEKQIISCLSWYRSRYALFLDLDPNRPADKENIETFGGTWMGEFKEDWEHAFESLLKKEIIERKKDEYAFTVKGELFKRSLEKEIPFFKYEYDNFFQMEKNSKAHAAFCREVYGENLSQHGLIDQHELAVLIDKLNKNPHAYILDAGCGNGKLTEYLAMKVDGEFLGFDIADEGIRLAKERKTPELKVHFEVNNLNAPNFSKKFDAILFLDTLYYAEDLTNTISNFVKFLTKGGKIYAYFSQWIMQGDDSEKLTAENTDLAIVLKDLALKFTTYDLTRSGLEHWNKKLEVIERMKESFIEEGNVTLWNYRYREALRYANWGDERYSRYLYEIQNDLLEQE